MQRKQRIRNKRNDNTLFYIVAITLIIVTSLISGFMIRFKQVQQTKYNQNILSNCQNLEEELKEGNSEKLNITNKGSLQYITYLEGKVNKFNTEKYIFEKSEKDRKIDYQTVNSIQACIYDNQYNLVTDNILSKSREYSLFIITKEAKQNYKLTFETTALSKENSSVSSNDVEEDTKAIEDLDSDLTTNSNQLNQDNQIGSEINVSYNLKNQPQFQNSQRLKRIVNNLINLSKANNLPVNEISITLIDVNNKTIAQYQGDQPRYPASITKLFWLVMLYSYIEEGKITLNNNLSNQIDKMMSKSDNEAASDIIDSMTDTESGAVRSKEQFDAWYRKRMQLNKFFNEANYFNLNITQKTYPIPYLEDYGKRPKGRELDMRHLGESNENNPIRNKLTTWHAARLMYEIVTEKAVSPYYSQKIQDHLERNLEPQAWKNIDPNFEFNPVLAFFGQGLPTKVRFLSKAGWTSSTRQEVAYIETPDQETRYILAIFAENEGYAQNWEIFPQLSESAFEQMTN